MVIRLTPLLAKHTLVEILPNITLHANICVLGDALTGYKEPGMTLFTLLQLLCHIAYVDLTGKKLSSFPIQFHFSRVFLFGCIVFISFISCSCCSIFHSKLSLLHSRFH